MYWPSPSHVNEAFCLISCLYIPAFKKKIVPFLVVLISPNLGSFFYTILSSYEAACIPSLRRISSSILKSTVTPSFNRSKRVAAIKRSSTLDRTIPNRRRILKASSVALLLPPDFERPSSMRETRKDLASLRLESIIKLSLSVLYREPGSAYRKVW